MWQAMQEWRWNSGWNQTKMGLKWRVVERSIEEVMRLKSDQDGIEILFIFSHSHDFCSWNQTKMGLKFVYHNRLVLGMFLLKSDQDGIEIFSDFLHDAISHKWLKSDQDGIEIAILHFSSSVSSLFVEIRPRWDWNNVNYWLNRHVCRAGWNQTKMGLKFGFLYTSRIVMLKSDQDGIEMREQRVAVSEMQRMVEIRQRKDYLNEICERALVFFSEKRLDICGE